MNKKVFKSKCKINTDGVTTEWKGVSKGIKKDIKKDIYLS